MTKKNPDRGLPEGIYPNKYRKACANPDCDVVVEPGQGFIERVEQGKVNWLTWCKDHVPEKSSHNQFQGRDQKSDDYYDEMIVVTQKGNPIPEEDIEKCAKELEIERFPRGYLELISRFGIGEFNHFLRIHPPEKIVELRKQNPDYRSLEIGDSIDGDRFCFSPGKLDWLFVIPRHHSGIMGAGWGVPKMLSWLVTDNELNESGFMTEVYYRPYSEETGMLLLKQSGEPPAGDKLDQALADCIAPDHAVRRFTDRGDKLELFYTSYGGQIDYFVSPNHSRLSIWLDCSTAADFLATVQPALAAIGFDQVVHVRNLPNLSENSD